MANIADFLKCEKVRCVDYDNGSDISKGKEYKVVGFSLLIKVIDDLDDEYHYPAECFEPILETAIQATDTEEQASEPLPAENAKPVFKAGQKAYAPWMNDGKIVTLEVDCNGDLCANTLKGKQDFDKYGVSFGSPTQPDLFHATQENYELLSKLMPWIDFEKPPVVLQGSDLCRAMLDKGWKYVVCEVGNHVGVYSHYDESGHIFEVSGCGSFDVTPLDPKTGNVLTSEVLDD